MGRRAVAATLVSFVIFTSLLLANSALYSAENSSTSALVLSTVQNRELADAGLLVGLSGYDSLSHVQAYLQSNPLDCSALQPYLDSLAGSQRQSGTEGGLTYEANTSWDYAGEGASGGSSAILQQFGGYEAGELNLDVVTSLGESYDGGLPSYAIQTLETVHLPVPLSSIVSSCLEALSELGAALSSLAYCNSTAVDDSVGAAAANYTLLDSYTIAASASPSPSGCMVDYWVTGTVGGLEGVTGTFQLTVQGEGSLET